ncbi:MAG TPA: hypothetical protein VNO22_13300, partial [Planctomycetota bacterium]|nr:hypothetical protein [Planctomycetota bacterium]
MSMDAELESLIREHLEGSLDAPGRERLARRLAQDSEALSAFADQLEVHHRLKVLLAERADLFTDSVLREIRFLADAPRFSQEVVGRIKGLEGRAVSRPRPAPVWAAAVFLAILGAILLFPRAPREGGPVVAAATSEVVVERGGRAMAAREGLDLRAGDRLRIPEGGFLVVRGAGVSRLEAGPGRVDVRGGEVPLHLPEGRFGAALPAVLSTPAGTFEGASGWVALEVGASEVRLEAEGAGGRWRGAGGRPLE